jgi:hypothetical protein
MATAVVEQTQVRRYTARNVQNALWRRQSLRAAFEQHTAYTAYEVAEVPHCHHVIRVPSRNDGKPVRVVWDGVKDEFYCNEHAMHTCCHSGAALLLLMARGLLPHMDSSEPGELEANTQVWRQASGK